jgi:quercetin dioxygenase-like cupin family protein
LSGAASGDRRRRIASLVPARSWPDAISPISRHDGDLTDGRSICGAFAGRLDMSARLRIERPTTIAPDAGDPLGFAGVVGRLKIHAADTDGRFAVAYFPGIPPHTLGAPLHRHHKEDEYSHVIEGTLSVQLGDEVVTASAGTWVLKPRGQWHTFWNATDLPCRSIEIVSPAGFERYFGEVAAAGGDLERLAHVNGKYSLDMQLESVQRLCARYGLRFPAP